MVPVSNKVDLVLWECSLRVMRSSAQSIHMHAEKDQALQVVFLGLRPVIPDEQLFVSFASAYLGPRRARLGCVARNPKSFAFNPSSKGKPGPFSSHPLT